MRQNLMRFGEEKEDQIEEAEKLDEYEQRECAVNLKQMLYDGSISDHCCLLNIRPTVAEAWKVH
jgi:hypothetical protein